MPTSTLRLEVLEADLARQAVSITPPEYEGVERPPSYRDSQAVVRLSSEAVRRVVRGSVRDAAAERWMVVPPGTRWEECVEA